MKRRVIFSLPYGMAFRNVVCCGVLDACLARAIRPIVLLPSLSAADAETVRQELPPGVEVRELLPCRASFLFTYFKLLKQYLYALRTGLDSFQIKYRRRRRQRPLFHLAARIAEVGGGLLISEPTLDRLIARARQPHEDHYRRLLEETRADALAIMKPGYQPEELPIIRAARALGVPAISIDTTWDNIASKRPPYLRPDRLTVWNERMFREAIRFCGFPPEGATVTGGSSFDVFFTPDSLDERGGFFRSLGLDPARRLIVFTLNHPMFTPDIADYVRVVLAAAKRGEIVGRPNVVVRIHPWDRFSSYEHLSTAYSRVWIERPFGVSDPSSVFECVPKRSDVPHYGALMKHADVLINVGSTTALDAIATDTPTVTIGFDLRDSPAEVSTSRLAEFTHFKPIVDSGAVRIAASREEFFATINMYLDSPERDRTERAAALKEFLTFADGRNAERIAESIQQVERDVRV